MSVIDHSHGYWATPAQPTAAVLVIHDWRGLTAAARDAVDWLGGAGLLAYAPQLITVDPRRSIFDAEDVRQSAVGALTRIRGEVEVLRDRWHPADRVGLVGFCFGGELALSAGLAYPELIGAIVTFYGDVTKRLNLLRQLRPAVQAHFAEEDHRIALADRQRLETHLAAHKGIPMQTFLYPATRHGFVDRHRSEYAPDAAFLASTRAIRFLTEHLRTRT